MALVSYASHSMHAGSYGSILIVAMHNKLQCTSYITNFITIATLLCMHAHTEGATYI